MKYDDASWHSGGNFPADLPPEAAATHIGMFVAWCVLNGLAGELHAEEDDALLNQLRARELTPGQWFLQACDGKFTDEDVNDDGNAFTGFYFEAEDMTYIADYQDSLADDCPSLYHVPDSWVSYDILAPVIAARYAAWAPTAA